MASFIGYFSINLLSGKFIAATGNMEIMAAGENREKSVLLKIPDPIAALAHDGQELILGLRPEAISVNRQPDQSQSGQSQSGMQAVEVHIEMLEPTGPETLAVVRWHGHELTARISRDADYKKSCKMSFLFDLNQAMLFDAKS